MREGLGASVAKEKANAADFVTEYDLKCQKTIHDLVHAAFPSHGFLGEEDVAPGAAASAEAIASKVAANDWLWVVDPIDGTTMFAHGITLSTVSIACAFKGEVVVGVIYEPGRDECFSAARGSGARLNGRSIAASTATELREALLFCGFSTRAAVRVPMLRGIGALCPGTRGVRSLGSAALHMAYVACGRATCFWELSLNSWDLAAGSLIVAEAGGRVTDTTGAAFSLATRDVLATGGAEALHAEFLRRLAACSGSGVWDGQAAEAEAASQLIAAGGTAASGAKRARAQPGGGTGDT